MFLLGIAAASSVSSQSRSTVLLIMVFPLVFGIQLRRRAENQINTALFCAMFALGSFGLLYLLQTGRFDYLYSVRHTGIQNDPSYTVRLQALAQLGRISGEIAPLGSGTGQSNNPFVEHTLGYDRFATIGVDNEWANSFEAFGVWGPIWLVTLFIFWATHLSRLRGDSRFEPSMVYYLCAGMLAVVLILSPTAVRIMKYETAGYTFVALAALSAWSLPKRASAS
jgi:hypothetical protein